MSGETVLFWVQHLLGIGHLRRAATLAGALRDAGMRVTVVSGGAPVPGLDLGDDLVQLPPTRDGDLSFKALVDAGNRPIDDAWRDDRRAQLLSLYERLRPDIVMTELYPFGRRQFRFELLPILEMARGEAWRPLVAASVRDLLVEPSKPERTVEMMELARRFYDMVLVHGDPALIRFEETFRHAAEIADRVRYTGYVVNRMPQPSRDLSVREEEREVLVSAGGGAVGEALLRTALAARPLSCLAEAPWRLLTGQNLPLEVYDDLRAQAPAGVTVERSRLDFPDLLRRCRLSLSQGGYNTVMEVLDAGARALVVPFAGTKTEQTLRTSRLADRAMLHMLREDALTPAALAAAIDRAMATPRPARAALDMSGAETTPRILRDALAARRGTGS